MLNVVGTIHDLIEPPELFRGQNTGQSPTLLRRSKLANRPDSLGDISPAVVIQPLFPDQSGDLGDELSFA